MRASVVLGAGFGDEGKGLMTSYLVSESDNPLVVRFNGGHQAGHTVVVGDQRHVFSHFGSGTLQGAPTYWSKYCTFDPVTCLNEYKALEAAGHTPQLFVDGLCPVVTPYDYAHNRGRERVKAHGSVGVGFGSTIARSGAYYNLYVQDLFYPAVLGAKLLNIARFYGEMGVTVEDKYVQNFYAAISQLKELRVLDKMPFDKKLREYDHVIFEGAQGILLDMDFGFFPNVTRSNTTSKNALELVKSMGLVGYVDLFDVEINYVTRTYQTRHGNGYMSTEHVPVHLVNNELETNVQDEYQGNFRTGILDMDMLNYAIECDKHFSPFNRRNILFTCADQTGDRVRYLRGGEEFNTDIDKLGNHVHQIFTDVFISTGPSYKNIESVESLMANKK